MKKTFFRLLSLLALLTSICFSVCAQTGNNSKSAEAAAKPAGTPAAATPAVSITATTAPIDLARAALAAQGGDKFKSLKSTVLRGSVDLYGPQSTRSLPGEFLLVTGGIRFRLEVNAPPFSFSQIFDGQQTYSSLPGVEIPPPDKFGIWVLTKVDEAGYTVKALPDKKKLRGFRIADAEGNATDFYLDPATGRVMNFTFSYKGYNAGTENEKFKEVEGVLIATSFTERIEMPQGAAFAEFKVKDIKVNQELGNEVFAPPN